MIDSIFGVGLNRPITEELQILFRNLNNSQLIVISIDMPSGVLTDTGQVSSVAIKADTTLTFHRLKPGHILLPGKHYSKDVKILDIGLVNVDIESDISLITKPHIKPLNSLTYIQ